MRVLLICGDHYHPAEVPVEGVQPLISRGFDFDIITDAGGLQPETLAGYPVILLCKSDEASQDDDGSWKTEAVQQAFAEHVEKGGGLLALHSATVAGEATETIDRLLGCRFLWHPETCPVTVQPVKPHPVTEGAGMFCEMDEHYRIGIIADDVDVLMASYSPPQGSIAKIEEDSYHNTTAWISACGYVRRQGIGRVCVLTPGHGPAVWRNPVFLRILENALNWCAGAEQGAE